MLTGKQFPLMDYLPGIEGIVQDASSQGGASCHHGKIENFRAMMNTAKEYGVYKK